MGSPGKFPVESALRLTERSVSQVQSVEGQWPDKDLKALRGGVSACWGICKAHSLLRQTRLIILRAVILDDSLKLDSQTKLPEFLPRLRTACLSIGPAAMFESYF